MNKPSFVYFAYIATTPEKLWKALTDGEVNLVGNMKHSHVTFEIEPLASAVRLVVTHDRLEADPDMASPISRGWPRVLSNLKSLMETGRPLPNLS
jgi:hypothetical protein